ncbi:MAG: universal stress protein, partial [Candidatus Thermoplasmatota archaeon]|nr:universal stress protein [Candidatus Thermoplasmatota archaeon]
MHRPEKLTPWLNQRFEILGHAPVRTREDPTTSVVGLDGTEDSAHAAAWAARLTSQVHLVYAEPRGYPGVGASPGALEALAGAGRFAIGLVESRLEGKNTKEHVLDGSPARAIAEVADSIESDLIIVGARHRAMGEGPGMGSVSETLAHHAPYPVLLATQPPGAGPVVLAAGEDASSREAAAWALRLSVTLARELHVLHSAPDDLERLELTGFTDQARDARAELVDWPPDKGIRSYLDERPAALLVLGHGRHHGWLGSTALQMLRAAPCPVL